MLAFVLMAWLAAAAVAGTPAVEIRAPVSTVVSAEGPAPIPLLVVNHSDQPVETIVRLEAKGCRPASDAMNMTVPAHGWRPFTVLCRLDGESNHGIVRATIGGSAVTVILLRGIDLSTLTWKRAFTSREAGVDASLAAPDLDDRQWPALHVPALWGDNRYAWCRVHVTIPASWRGRTVRLVMGAVDDNDITYLNGQEIGRTNGWDIRREYTLPESAIRWGVENVLTVMVDNPTFGGGIHRPPVYLVVGDKPVTSPTPAPASTAKRPAPGRIGPALPLRPMHVSEGVLRYPDGSEVALWGVNIYPQSWYQFENMQRLKVDNKRTIRQDLDHLQEMGVQAIRMHIFDREISDGDGNVRDNEHLDLLDYLVAECSRRGIYLYLTPIAWWGGPGENKDSFSAQTSKPGMMFVPRSVDAAANYLRQFLTRRNRYSGRPYKDEPALCVIEIMNEPAYFLYGDIDGSAYPPQGEPTDVLERDHKTFGELWRVWCEASGMPRDPSVFALFRYHLMRSYLRRMVEAIRSTGARQPVACNYFGVNGDDLTEAIADSEVDAVSFSNYPGGWERVNDGVNLLYAASPLRVDARLAGKARLAYEFDTPATNTSCYLYPALAAHFRAGEVQIACQFQYDSIATARWNTDWSPHWLNWHYTPSKAVSFMIGGETFRSLPRGVEFEVGDWRNPARDLSLGPMWCSFAANNCAFAATDTVLYARSVPSGTRLAMPTQPHRIVGTGSSRYVTYGGTGAYTITRITDRRLRLAVNPDARLVGNSLLGSFASPVAELEFNRHFFRLALPGWSRARCVAVDGAPRPEPVAGGWLLAPGHYEIIR